jgi:4-carboxymuconolactone decarboxylase
MARLPYATTAQFEELMGQSGFPENTPQSNAFSILAHTPAVGGQALRLVLALLTQTELDPKLRELVILRVAQRCDGPYVWVQHVAIAASIGVNEAQIAALEKGEAPANLFTDRERMAFAFTDEVLQTSHSTAAMIATLRELFSPREVVEMLLLIGYFRMISGLMTSLAVEVESPFGVKILDQVRDQRR